ncbi:MAG: hypothetical protein IKQ10_05290 [Oscillospiraceae bacterium]|nr:hypothetical protein [Oscillospiraceae bacterium]
MKRTGCLLLSLLLLLSAAGCTTRQSASAGPAPTSSPTAEPTIAPTPEPTPTPTPTPCPHLRWDEGVCADCGQVCPHENWEDGRCAVCGIACVHPDHDEETRRCTVCGKAVPHTYIDGVCTVCGHVPVFESVNVPRELFDPCERKGTVETVEYTTQVYTPSTSRVPIDFQKKFCVYLPWGYDPAQKYDVLILMHGIHSSERYWLGSKQDYNPSALYEDEQLDVMYDYVRTTDLLDNMIDRGLCRPLIVVTPTFYKDSSNYEDYNRRLDQARFFTELRETILPMVTEKYATWAAGGSLEEISAAREHFGYAGLSMGSIYGYTTALPDCLNLFSWYGLFSGSDGYIDQIAAALNSKANAGRPIYYCYNAIGSEDMYYNLHVGQYRQLVSWTKGLTEGVNAAMTVIEGSNHEYSAWGTGLYNFLQVAFSLPRDSAEEAAPEPPEETPAADPMPETIPGETPEEPTETPQA